MFVDRPCRLPVNPVLFAVDCIISDFASLASSPGEYLTFIRCQEIKTSSSSYSLFLVWASVSRRRRRRVLFNHALNTFYLRLYSVKHMVKDHSYSERGNLLLPHGLLFLISSKGSFIVIIPQTVFDTPVVEHWLEREIAQWVHHEGSI